MNQCRFSLRAAFCILGLFAEMVSMPAALSANGVPRRSGEAEVDRIEVTGITLFERPEIEAALELTAGDRLERTRVVRTEENFQALYLLHGYEEVKVRSELLREKVADGKPETVLKFSITEGRPTRIAQVVLIPQTIRDEKFRNYWNQLSSSLASAVGLTAGDVYDQEKLGNGKRLLTDALASEEFIGAKVDDIRISTVSEPAAVPEKQRNAARWVSIEFHLDLGDRVSFGFRGNKAVPRSRLQALIEEQRLLGFSKDYVGSIRARFEEEYRSLGYSKARVVPYTFERPSSQERHVTYEIDEGTRVFIDSIDFEGSLAFSNSQLKTQFKERTTPLVRKGIFIEQDVEKAAELVVEWIKSQGYLGSKVVAVNRSFSPRGDRVKLIVYLYEGEQTIVKGAEIKGVSAFTSAKVMSMLGISENAPLNLYAFNEGLEVLKSTYRARGFLDMRIANENTSSVIRYSQENRVAQVELEVAEGIRYRISHIEIDGLSGTRGDVVIRELMFREGDILEEPAINESEARLRKLGIFGSVNVRVLDDTEKPGYKIIRVALQEGTPGIVAGGVGFRNDLGARVFAQSAYTNLWHRNHTVSFNATANQRFDREYCGHHGVGSGVLGNCFVEYQLQLGYVWPWFAFGETTFRPRLTLEKTQYSSFDAQTVSAQAIWERRLLRNVNLVGGFTYGLERTRQFNSIDPITNQPLAVDNQTLTIGSITPSLKLDLRDNSLAPTQGLFAVTSFEFADPAFLSQAGPPPIGYTRFQFRTDYFVPLAKEVTWYLSFRTGIERNLQPPPNGGKDPAYQIPLIKQFSLGGAGSLRGFKEQELNIQNIAVLGTASYVNYRTQVDLPFAGPLRFGPFLDAANLLVDRYSLGMLRYGTGVGFHYQSPVGPVNFDLGFKIDPKPGEDPYRFYFSIGII